MTLNTWCVFALTVFILSGTPGPNMLHIMNRSVRLGAKRCWPAMLGCLLAVVLALILSAAGVGALLLASPAWFEALRYIGVGYLLWLGLQAWRHHEDAALPDAGQALSGKNAWMLFRGGFAVSASNPKLLLFAVMFLPQFINPAAPQWPQLMILIVTFAAMEVFWYVMYALGGEQLCRLLTTPRLRRTFDRAVGATFIGFGVMLWRFKA